jgi:hypothetical protein
MQLKKQVNFATYTTGMGGYAKGQAIRDGQKSGQSAYGPAGLQSYPRCSVAVGVARSTLSAALVICLALDVDRATPTATLGIGYFSNLCNFVKIITNSYDVRKGV